MTVSSVFFCDNKVHYEERVENVTKRTGHDASFILLVLYQYTEI